MTSESTAHRATTYGPHVICTRCDIRVDGRPLRDDNDEVRGVEYRCPLCAATALYGLRPVRTNLTINAARTRTRRAA